MGDRPDPDQRTDDRGNDEGDDDLVERQREIVESRPTGEERLYTAEPLDTGEGVERPAQQNVGRQQEQGSGEWPHPRTPPRPPGEDVDEDHGGGPVRDDPAPGDG